MPTATQELTIPHPFITGLRVSASSASPGGIHSQAPIHLPEATVTICSVYPRPLDSQVYYQLYGRPQFHMRPVEKGKYELLTLKHTFSVLNISTGNEPPQPTPKPRYAVDPNNPESANGYAVNLIEEWAGGRPGTEDGRIGVGIIIGDKPWQDGNKPLSQEIDNLHRIQRKFFLHLISKADDAFLSNDDRRKRTVAWGECRAALEYASHLYDEDVAKHPWYVGRDSIAQSVKCPACFEAMNAAAIICRACHTDLATHFMDHGYHIGKDWEKQAKLYPGASQEILFRLRKEQEALTKKN